MNGNWLQNLLNWYWITPWQLILIVLAIFIVGSLAFHRLVETESDRQWRAQQKHREAMDRLRTMDKIWADREEQRKSVIESNNEFNQE